MRIYRFNQLSQLCFELNNAKAIIVPTDTVMGIISKVPSLIYEIKNRPHYKKLILFVGNIDSVKGLTKLEKNILKKYWPGPLTIIKNGIGYRMPRHHQILKLLTRSGPLYSSSANIFNKPPIKNSKQGIAIFNQWVFELVMVVGKQKSSTPSTIIDFDKKILVRAGSIPHGPIIKKLQKAK